MQGNKRKQHGGGGGGSKPGSNKKRYISRPTGSKPGIPLNSRGILISCTTGKESQAGREAVNLFTQIYEEMGGTWKQQAGGGRAAADAATDGGDADDAASTDIAAALASEVAELKEGSRNPLFYHLTGIGSVVYVEYKDSQGPAPSAMVAIACQATADTGVSKTRFCSRFYPVEYTCFASMEKIGELAARVVAQHFPEDAEPIQFAVQFDARAAPQFDRMKVIDAFASLVKAPHKVNLGSPQKTILINIVKGTCGVAVVEQYKELWRYNIRTLAMPAEEREAQAQEQRDAEKARQARLLAEAEAAQPAAAAAPQEQQEQQAEGGQAEAAEAQQGEAEAEIGRAHV